MKYLLHHVVQAGMILLLLHHHVVARGMIHQASHHVAQAGMTTVLQAQARVALGIVLQAHLVHLAGTVVQAQAIQVAHQAGINYGTNGF